MPIAIAPTGRELSIRRVGADEKIKRHLQELGISEGGKITLVSSNGGNVIVIVKEGRLCLDKTLAGKILVA
ncbi:MAG: ferrous iron transport protein A [Clostridia bacterium]|nr:ferrous iron transport protein A [Clostridia bacterium]MDE7181686.1 ferrous iron transport protein A [Clostridia bacterium]